MLQISVIMSLKSYEIIIRSLGETPIEDMLEISGFETVDHHLQKTEKIVDGKPDYDEIVNYIKQLTDVCKAALV